MANPEQVDIKSWRMSGTPVDVWSGALAAATTTNPNGKKGSSSAEQQAMGPRHNSLLSESLFLGGINPTQGRDGSSTPSVATPPIPRAPAAAFEHLKAGGARSLHG